MLGERIKELRTKKKMTQLELATILNVSDRTVSKWEQLKGNPDIDIIPALADSLCVSCDYLLTGKESIYRINNAQTLYDFINNKIAPFCLGQNDLISLEALSQEHDFDFLCGCFLIAQKQVMAKEVDDANYVSLLMQQFSKVVFAKSRPLLIQKMSELFYVYKNKHFDNYLSKESFTKRMYFYLNKAKLKTDEEKIAYIDNTLMPIIINSRDNNELKENLKKLLKKESPFDSNNSLTEDPVIDDSLIDQKAILFEQLKPEEYLTILQKGRKIAPADRKIINMLRKDYGLSNPVINVVLDFCLFKGDYTLNRKYIEKVAASIVRKELTNARETMDYFIKIEKENKTEI